jgi:L-cysteate sulfo-lyase
MQAAAEALREAGHRPYVIPGGGSNTVGARGYVACMEEILADARRQDLRIDHLVHATGSAGTQAGLVAGRAAAGSDIPIHGISVRFDRARQEAKVHDLAQALARELGAGDIPEAAVSAYDGYVGPGYGQPTDGMVEAIGLVARTEGLLLDPVYSGKGMAGLIDLIRQGRFDDRENVVFLHTGGAVSLFGYTWAFPGAERSAGRPAAV